MRESKEDDQQGVLKLSPKVSEWEKKEDDQHFDQNSHQKWDEWGRREMNEKGREP